MDSLCLLPGRELAVKIPCCRCGEPGGWDRVAGKPYCPDCEEGILLGVQDPLREPTQPHACAACPRVGTVRYVTLPLHDDRALAIDLCPDHLRGLLGRKLTPGAFRHLRRRLARLRLPVDEVFLLHDAFYDKDGRALQPIDDPE
jgi:hypothetical protein